MILRCRLTRAISIVFIAAMIADRAVAQQQTTPSSKSELVVGRDDFQQLRWTTGRWRVESDGIAATFERYRFADDSTLIVERYADNKFRSPVATVRFELRANRVSADGGPTRWIMTGLASTTASFRAPTGTPTEAIWRRYSENEWVRIFSWPPTVDQPGRTVTYRLKRLRGS